MKHFVLLSFLSALLIVAVVAVKSFPQDPVEKIKAFNSSINFEAKNNLNNAISELQKVYNDNKNDYLINLRLGWLYYSKTDYDNSVKYYTSAVNIRPSSIEAKMGLVFPLAAKNEWQKVKNIYKDVLKIDANHFTANLRLGQIHLNSLEYQEAKKYLEKVISLYPGEYEPNLSLGYTYYYIGDKTKARLHLNTALMLSPDDQLAKEGLKLIK
jgi:tetratricopeptide (TPR) repeat protein